MQCGGHKPSSCKTEALLVNGVLNSQEFLYDQRNGPAYNRSWRQHQVIPGDPQLGRMFGM